MEKRQIQNAVKLYFQELKDYLLNMKPTENTDK